LVRRWPAATAGQRWRRGRGSLLLRSEVEWARDGGCCSPSWSSPASTAGATAAAVAAPATGSGALAAGSGLHWAGFGAPAVVVTTGAGVRLGTGGGFVKEVDRLLGGSAGRRLRRLGGNPTVAVWFLRRYRGGVAGRGGGRPAVPWWCCRHCGPGGGHTSLLGLAGACARAGAGGSGGVPSLSARPLLLLDGGHFVAVVGFHAGVRGRPFYAVLPHMILVVGAERSQRGRRPRRLRGCWSGALPQIRDLQGMGRCPRWTYTAAEGWFFGMWSGRRGCWRSFAAACVAGASTPSEWPRPVVWRRRLWCLAGTRHLDRRPCCGFFGRRPGDGDTCGCRSPR